MDSDSMVQDLLWLRKYEWKLLRVAKLQSLEGIVLQIANYAQDWHKLQGGKVHLQS